MPGVLAIITPENAPKLPALAKVSSGPVASSARCCRTMMHYNGQHVAVVGRGHARARAAAAELVTRATTDGRGADRR